MDNQYSVGSENAPAILSLEMNLRFTRDRQIIPYLADTIYIFIKIQNAVRNHIISTSNQLESKLKLAALQ